MRFELPFVDDDVPDWISRLHFLEHIVGTALVDGRLQALGEPARLFYLEPHEREPDFS